MSPLVIVELEPSVSLPSKVFHRRVESGPERLFEEPIEKPSVESVHKGIGVTPGYLSSPVPNVMELHEDLIGMDHVQSVIQPTIICENVFYLEAMGLREGPYPVVEDIRGVYGSFEA